MNDYNIDSLLKKAHELGAMIAESAEFKNTIRQSNVRVTIKRIDDEKNIYVAGLEGVRFGVYIENIQADNKLSLDKGKIMSDKILYIILSVVYFFIFRT